jgi:hypothetical protein
MQLAMVLQNSKLEDLRFLTEKSPVVLFVTQKQKDVHFAPVAYIFYIIELLLGKRT